MHRETRQLRRRSWAPKGLLAPITLVALTSASPAPAQVTIQAIPEYHQVKAVLLSEDLFNYEYEAPALVKAIVDAGAEAWIATENKAGHEHLNAALPKLGVSAATLRGMASLELPHGNIWLRDYGPLPVLVTNADKTSHLGFVDVRYDGAAKTMDEFPKVAGNRLGVPVDSVALDLDGGNFLTTGDFCFTSVMDLRITKDVQAAKDRLGCKTMVVFGNPPHAHLDMWAKIVDDHTVLVNQLDERTLEVVKALYGNIPNDVQALADNLDARAKEWARYLKVVRLPMPLPYRHSFRTYANSALVNGTAIVPSYSRFGWNYDDYPDAKLKAYYEEKVTGIYEKLGFKVKLIPADGLLYNGGAFHCVTSQIPAFPTSSPQALKGH